MSRKPQPKWGLDGILALLRTPTEPTTDAQFSWKAGTEPRSAWACAAAAFPCWAAFCPLLPQPHFWPRVVSPSKGLSRRAEPAALYTPYPNRPFLQPQLGLGMPELSVTALRSNGAFPQPNSTQERHLLLVLMGNGR